jgi:hypothetical protein
MDWNLAIDINRAALKRVLAALVAMAGLGNGQSAIASRQSGSSPEQAADDPTDCPLPTADCRPFLPRHLHRAVLRLLRPAEAAARRLIIVASRGIVVAPLPPPRPRKVKATPSLFVRNGRGTGIVLPPGMARREAVALFAGCAGAHRARAARSVGFPLFDPVRDPLRRRRPRSSGVPRIWALGEPDSVFAPVRKPPMPDDPIDAARLARRLAALGRVLDDLPKQARRFARWRVRAANAARAQDRKARRIWPLKPGLPPGARRPGSRRKGHEIDEILGATHGLAFWSMTHADTS